MSVFVLLHMTAAHERERESKRVCCWQLELGQANENGIKKKQNMAHDFCVALVLLLIVVVVV